MEAALLEEPQEAQVLVEDLVVLLAAEDNAVTLEQSKHFEQQCKLSRRPDNKVPESV